MGNRAVIAFKAEPKTGIYLHWNGGPESVLAFIDAAKQRGARGPEQCDYAFAALASTIGLFIHAESMPGFSANRELLSFGIGPIETLDCDNYDNGLYWIDYDWTIASREYTSCKKFTVDDLNQDERNRYDAIIEDILEKDRVVNATNEEK